MPADNSDSVKLVGTGLSLWIETMGPDELLTLDMGVVVPEGYVVTGVTLVREGHRLGHVHNTELAEADMERMVAMVRTRKDARW